MIVAAVSFVLLATVLLWTLVWSKGRWWWKLAMVVAVPWWCFSIWQALGSFDGWAAQRAPATAGEYVASYVREPAGGDPGAIWLWIVDTGDRGVFAHRETAPRAFRIPYSRRDHEQLEMARQAAAHGVRLKVKVRKEAEGANSDSARSRQRLTFELPQERLPEK